MGDSDKTFDVGLKVTSDVSGASGAKEELAQFKKAAEDAGDAGKKVQEGSDEASEGLSGVRETAVEAGHGLHGAHLAAEGLSRAAAGGEGALSGLAFAFRGIGMAISAGGLGLAAVALTALVEGLNFVIERSKKAAEEQKAIAEQAEATRQKIEETVTEAEKLKEPAEAWKTALEDAKTALDESMSAIKTINAEQDKLLSSQEKLALAKVENSNLSDSDKEQARYEVQARFAMLKQQNATDLFNKEIEHEQEKVKLADTAAEKARQDAAEKNGALNKAAEDAQKFQERVEAAKKRLAGGQFAETNPLEQQYMHGKMSESDYAAGVERIKNERAGLKNWLDSQVGDDKKPGPAQQAIDKQLKDAADAAKKANEAVETENKAAVDASMSGGTKIGNLTTERDNAAKVYQNQQDAAEQDRMAKAKAERDKQIDKNTKAQIEHDKQVQEAVDAAQKAEHERQVKAAQLAVQEDEERLNRAKLGEKETGAGARTGAHEGSHQGVREGGREGAKQGAHEGVREGGREGARTGAHEGVKEGLLEGLKETLGAKGGLGGEPALGDEAASPNVTAALTKMEEDKKKLLELENAQDPDLLARKKALEDAKLADELVAEGLKEAARQVREGKGALDEAGRGEGRPHHPTHRSATEDADEYFRSQFGGEPGFFGPGSKMSGSSLDHPGPASSTPDDSPGSIFGPGSKMRGSELDHGGHGEPSGDGGMDQFAEHFQSFATENAGAHRATTEALKAACAAAEKASRDAQDARRFAEESQRRLMDLIKNCRT